MILDDGICTVFRRVNVAERGNMPKYRHDPISRHWYKMLDFGTVPANRTGDREETRTDARLRILEDRRITNQDVIVLANVPRLDDVLVAYEVTRAYHGRDTESGERITDMTLTKVRP